MLPKVSIITVSYNSENVINDTINSVLEQNYSNIEHILVDGASSDKTLEKIKEYAINKRIIYISEKDNGIYDAMNKGIGISTGDIIYFLNCGDTLYDNNVITKIANYYINNNVDILYGDIIFKYDKSEQLQLNKDTINKEFFQSEKMVCHQAIFSKKIIFDKYGDFVLDYKLCSDFDWFLKCYKEGVKIEYIPLIIAKYDKTGVSSDISNKQKIIDEHYDILKKRYGYKEVIIARFRRVRGNLKKFLSRILVK